MAIAQAGEERPAETQLWGGTLLLTHFLSHPLTPATSLVLSTTRIQIDVTDVPASGPPRPARSTKLSRGFASVSFCPF